MGIRRALCLRIISRRTDRFWRHPSRERAIPTPAFEVAVASRAFNAEGDSANGGSSSTNRVMAFIIEPDHGKPTRGIGDHVEAGIAVEIMG
jgi:hypothetical protein